MGAGVLKYGDGDEVTASLAIDNFAGAQLAALSFCCTPLELLSNDGKGQVLSHATGFFWRGRENTYLISNWHVFSGRNPFTGNLLSQSGYIPKRIAAYGCSLDLADGQLRITRPRFEIHTTEWQSLAPIDPPDVNGKVVDLWACIIHPSFVFGKDAARKGFVGADIMSCFVNDHIGTRIECIAGDDCYLLGYPLPNYDGIKLPVWKRGSIASDTLLGVSKLPIFLVDAATMSGMSGSPIFRRATTVTASIDNTNILREFHVYEFIGVYAGRLNDDSLARVNLGYAWYKTFIEAMLLQVNRFIVSVSEEHASTIGAT